MLRKNKDHLKAVFLESAGFSLSDLGCVFRALVFRKWGIRKMLTWSSRPVTHTCRPV